MRGRCRKESRTRRSARPIWTMSRRAMSLAEVACSQSRHRRSLLQRKYVLVAATERDKTKDVCARAAAAQ